MNIAKKNHWVYFITIENIITWDYECIFTGLDINGCVPFQSEFIIILHTYHVALPYICPLQVKQVH